MAEGVKSDRYMKLSMFAVATLVAAEWLSKWDGKALMAFGAPVLGQLQRERLFSDLLTVTVEERKCINVLAVETDTCSLAIHYFSIVYTLARRDIALCKK